MSRTSARSAARTASPPQLSRANIIFLEQSSFSAALPCGRHYIPHTKWLPKITDYRDTAALIPNTIGNFKKRDGARGCARGINTTWENLQIENHKPGRRSFRSPDWFVLFDLQIFSDGVYPLSATSRTISFSFSNSFWYYRKRGSASYIVREVHSVRERERERERYRERERRKWRHHCRAKIGDEFCTSPCQKCAPYSPWANPEKSLRKGSLVPRAGTKVSLHKCED